MVFCQQWIHCGPDILMLLSFAVRAENWPKLLSMCFYHVFFVLVFGILFFSHIVLITILITPCILPLPLNRIFLTI